MSNINGLSENYLKWLKNVAEGKPEEHQQNNAYESSW